MAGFADQDPCSNQVFGELRRRRGKAKEFFMPHFTRSKRRSPTCTLAVAYKAKAREDINSSGGHWFISTKLDARIASLRDISTRDSELQLRWKLTTMSGIREVVDAT